MKTFKRIMTGAGMLAVCSLLSKLLGAMYRIPLTNILGAEGMGLYQMVYPLYTLLLTVSSGGLPVAVSRLIAVRLSKKDEKGARKILYVSIAALSVLGFAASALLLIFNKPLALAQGNIKASTAYLGIAPAVLFVAVISCFRGYFQGRRNMLPTALSQLIEQGIKLGLGLYLAGVMSVYGIEYGVLGALIGVSVSEVAALAALYVIYIFTRRRVKNLSRLVKKRALLEDASADFLLVPVGDEAIEAVSPPKIIPDTEESGQSVKQILKSIIKVALPVTFGSLILPLTQVIDSLIIVNILTARGFSPGFSTTAYGLLNGTVITLVNMPAVLLSAMPTALMPTVAKSVTENRDTSPEIVYNFKIVLALSVPMALGLMIYGGGIVSLLYSGGLNQGELSMAAELLTMCSPAVFYVGIVQVATAVLQGYDRSRSPAFNLFIGAVVKVAASAAAMIFFGIYGAVIGTVLCYAVTAVLDVVSLNKVWKSTLEKKYIFSLLVSSAVFGFSLWIFKTVFSFLPLIAEMLISAVLSAALYFAALYILKWFTREELLRTFPFFQIARKKYLK